MRRNLSWVLCAASLAAVSCPTFAISGLEFDRRAQAYERMALSGERGVSQDDKENGIWFLSYVAVTTEREDDVCPPIGVTKDQLAAIVSKYVRDHPEQWHKDSYVLALTALHSAFPCPKKK